MNDILTGIPVAEGVIPESVETFSEAANYVIENTQMEFNELLESEGIVDENGQLIVNENTEVVTEGIGDVKDRFVEILQSAWSSIKAWFEKVIKWFKEKAAKAKEFLDAQVEKIKDKMDDIHQARITKKFKDVKVSDLKATDKLGKTHEFDKLENISYVGAFDKSQLTLSKIDVKNATSAKEAASNFKEEINRVVKELPGRIVGGDTRMSVSVMRSEIKKECTGKEIEYTGMNFKDSVYTKMMDVVLYNSTQKLIKSEYNEARKAIKNSIAITKKFKPNGEAGKTVKATVVSGLKTMNMILHAAHSAVMDVCKQRYSEYMRILSAVARISGKAARERKRKERQNSKKANASTEFESLFDF